MTKRLVVLSLALGLGAGTASAVPIESVIGSFALACMGDLSRGISHREFEGALAAQGFQEMPRAEAERFLASAGGRPGSAYVTTFADTGDTLMIGLDASGNCTFSSPTASRSGTEDFLLRSYDQIRSRQVQSTTEGGLVDATYAVTVGGSRQFLRFLGPGGRGGAVVMVSPESRPPPAAAGVAVTWP
ncbi:MAG: hypothetical protein IT535_00175 [Bauldia sp.]|nr:hypothetical protein [Bauldia sp.]